ncbi:site-specific DNA-methyltransferase [Hydrogenophaga sp.]|uniref:DNA-methyltransferase n=1 Tax=Hydrogenophaga sp. TaxID=1904254 RepID=UPI002722429F|nr:site-specific DNA-methyltransferase [Hydrogenophaga sp.]MDO9131704.1 site-specific DNA-methyltransferase [Hydrogenophaga sp.]
MNATRVVGNATIHVGDCLESLKNLADCSVQTCVTSPPYFGLRDYGVDGQIGLEPTPDEFVAALVAVFREVRRVLRDDGTLWLNIGDSYAGSGGAGSQYQPGGIAKTGTNAPSTWAAEYKTKPVTQRIHGFKSKDLIGVPWMLAFALRADGWFLRQDIIWNKPHPMPESVKDRCTKAHEYVFLLSKSPKYFYDHDAVKERSVDGSTKRNRRSVWTVATRPYKGAHFATFPPDLIEPCILAGCPEGGVVLDPFLGSGTTAAVALKHGRKAIGLELNPDYVELAIERIQKSSLPIPAKRPAKPPSDVQPDLLELAEV